MGVFDNIGYSFKGEKGELKVIKGSIVVMIGIKKNSLYSLIRSIVVGTFSIVNVKSKSSKTNQGPHLVLIYYKLFFFYGYRRKRNFQTEELVQTEEKFSDGSSRRKLSSDNTV